MMIFGSALREHMKECLEARKETNRSISRLEDRMEKNLTDMENRMSAGFGEARRRMDERHEENRKAIEALTKSIAKAAFWTLGTILTAFLLDYLATHGFKAPGIN